MSKIFKTTVFLLLETFHLFTLTSIMRKMQGLVYKKSRGENKIHSIYCYWKFHFIIPNQTFFDLSMIIIDNVARAAMKTAMKTAMQTAMKTGLHLLIWIILNRVFCVIIFKKLDNHLYYGFVCSLIFVNAKN